MSWLSLRNDGGQDLLEYAILAGLIAVVAYASVETVGNTINTVFWEYIADFPL
jgi:Flp pilus assembly pilin Flp